ncbi:MAG: hypothetical protein IAE78_00410 [Myxococcus sp.]|nr:hypothetical protein [Myxococcus sp.]
MNLSDPLALAAPNPMPVPAAYAEKAMASIMQLHGELMDEKEKRVELFRRLMEKEQALAELKMYVKLLEERGGVAREPVRPPEPRAPRAERAESTDAAAAPKVATPPVVPRVAQRPEGWKAW